MFDIDAREALEVDNIEKIAKIDVANYSYTGCWNTKGFTTSTGKFFSHAEMWEFTNVYRQMAFVSNIVNEDGVCPLDWGAKKLGNVLELGCGWGNHWPVFEGAFDKVYGVEIVEWCVKKAVSLGRDIKREMMENTGFGADFFGAVFSYHTLEHGESPDAVLREIRRVTKPGGWSVHTLPCRHDEVVKKCDIHKSDLSSPEWKQRFVDYGFEIIRDFYGWCHNQEDWTIVARKI